MTRKNEPIKTLLKRYRNEWLLIDVESVDKRTRVPITGRLLLHSARKEDLSKEFRVGKGRLYRIFAGPALPAGFAAAF